MDCRDVGIGDSWSLYEEFIGELNKCMLMSRAAFGRYFHFHSISYLLVDWSADCVFMIHCHFETNSPC